MTPAPVTPAVAKLLKADLEYYARRGVDLRPAATVTKEAA